MRVLRHLIPLDNIACTVRAEHGIRRILHIGGRVVGSCRDDFLRVVARFIPGKAERQSSASFRVCCDLGPVVAHGGNRRRSGQNRAVSTLFRRLKRAVHSLNVGHGASDALVRQLQPKRIIRLKQQAFRAHKAVADGTIGCLTEVAAFRVLNVCASCNNGYLHIRYGCTGQHAQMRFFRQVCQNQALPVQVKHIGRARR